MIRGKTSFGLNKIKPSDPNPFSWNMKRELQNSALINQNRLIIIKEGDISFKGQLVVQKSCRNLAFDKKMPISFCCEILLQFSDRTFCIQFGVNLIKLKYVRNLLTTAKILENNLHFFSWIYRALKMVSAKPKIVRKWCR